MSIEWIIDFYVVIPSNFPNIKELTCIDHVTVFDKKNYLVLVDF